MKRHNAESVARRLRLALDMFTVGEAMMRQRLKRERGDVDGARVERLMRAWLMTRPGAEHGDASGRPGQFGGTR